MCMRPTILQSHMYNYSHDGLYHSQHMIYTQIYMYGGRTAYILRVCLYRYTHRTHGQPCYLHYVVCVQIYVYGHSYLLCIHMYLCIYVAFLFAQHTARHIAYVSHDVSICVRIRVHSTNHATYTYLWSTVPFAPYGKHIDGYVWPAVPLTYHLWHTLTT